MLATFSGPSDMKSQIFIMLLTVHCKHLWLSIGLRGTLQVYDRFKFLDLRQEQNTHQFTEDIFKCLFVKGTLRILIEIDNKFSLIPVMAWRRIGDKHFLNQ